MDARPGRGKARRAFTAPPAVVALVRRDYMRGGRRYLDCLDPRTGQEWPNVPVLGDGGGPDVWATVPVSSPGGDGDEDLVELNPDQTEAAQAVLVFRDAHHKSAVCVRVLQHVKVELGDVPPDDVADTDDHPGTVSRQDFAWTLRGLRMIVDDGGDGGRFTLDAKGDPIARIQLLEDGRLRVSRDGTAGERLLLAGPTLTFLDAWINRYNALVVRVNALDAAMAAVYGLLNGPAAPPTPANKGPITYAAPGQPAEPQPATDATLKAAAFDVSPDDEAAP